MRSYQDVYQLVTIHTHDHFIVLPHCETMLSALEPDIKLSHIILPLRYVVLGGLYVGEVCGKGKGVWMRCVGTGNVCVGKVCGKGEVCVDYVCI